MEEPYKLILWGLGKEYKFTCDVFKASGEP